MIREITVNNYFKNNIVCSTFLNASRISTSRSSSTLDSYEENIVLHKVKAIWHWISKLIYSIACILFCYRPRDSALSIKEEFKKEIPFHFKYNKPLCHVSIKKLKKEQEINKQLNCLEKVQKGLSIGANNFFGGIEKLGIPTFLAVQFIFFSTLKLFISKKTICFASQLDPLIVFGVVPIVEEVLFRGCLNNGIFLGQELLKKITPSFFQGSVFNYITSPSPRLLFVHSLFSYAHGSMAPFIFLYASKLTLLHETSGIIASISAHVAMNIAAFGVQQIICRFI